MSKDFRTKNHAAFRLQYHIVFVIKYRHQCLNGEILSRLESIFRDVLRKWDCDLLEFSGESDHVHLLVDAHPALEVSRLAGNLKTVSARRIRSEYTEHLKPYFWKPYFWSRSYCVVSAGGASLETLKAYIEQQDRPA
ncbi:IS200/IS605 family transposase [Marinobacter bryozoorum]|uniref:IS200/IS605 family transposase n=1 Tax=Marinobacter bryozoorum TaxID=256324 RepID=UPI002002D317|nr:IS200/IS605 family transposase [Marinobacter bryozoorum]MCK7545803.1 IS200/IS605 family transposase [Marinobacter bryozoorum]